MHSSLIHACVHAMEQTQDQRVTSLRLSVIKTVLKKAGMTQNSDGSLPGLILSQSEIPWMDEFLENQHGFQ